MSEHTKESNVAESTTRAAMIALNRAIDAFYEAEAGHQMERAARMLRAYGRQTADTTMVLGHKANAAWETLKAKKTLASNQTLIQNQN